MFAFAMVRNYVHRVHWFISERQSAGQNKVTTIWIILNNTSEMYSQPKYSQPKHSNERCISLFYYCICIYKIKGNHMLG